MSGSTASPTQRLHNAIAPGWVTSLGGQLSLTGGYLRQLHSRPLESTASRYSYTIPARREHICRHSTQALPLTMSEERSKISLRSGTRKKRRPEISAPRQISKPIAQDGAVRVPPGATDAGPRSRPRPPPAAGGKVSFAGPRRWHDLEMLTIVSRPPTS